MRKMYWLIVLPALLFGCASSGGPSQQDRVQPEPITVTVSGYAAMSSSGKAVTLQHRLKVMRASRLDAYRAMAESVYGIALAGESSVSDLALRDDRYRALIDTTVRGARVVDVRELAQGGYETVMELTLPADFLHCLNPVNQFRLAAECRLPMPMGGESEPASPAFRQPYMIANDQHLGDR